MVAKTTKRGARRPALAELRAAARRLSGKPVAAAGRARAPTHQIAEAARVAARWLGSDGKGSGGLPGYLVWLARNEPKAFAALLAKVLPLERVIAATAAAQELNFEWLQAEMVRRGMAVPARPPRREVEEDPADATEPPRQQDSGLKQT